MHDELTFPAVEPEKFNRNDLLPNRMEDEGNDFCQRQQQTILKRLPDRER